MKPTLVTLYCFMAVVSGAADDGYACDSEIYCKGDLLRTVQLSEVYPDSKTFVDMVLKDDPSTVLQSFAALNASYNGAIPLSALQQFLNNSFSPPGEELESWTPTDWSSTPRLLSRIADDTLREFARDVNALWKTLGRQIKSSISGQTDRYSFVNVPNPFIIPGDRFREYYYWDTYWIVQGLIHCDMLTTAKGIIDNFVYLINTFGFVPNGGRVYYTKRSQPPVFALMVDAYYQATNNLSFVEARISAMDAEYNFWVTNRSVVVTPPGSTKQYTVSRYNVSVWYPRPEGYREDYQLTLGLPEANKTAVEAHVTSTCESGWDFSTRWFGGDSLVTVRTRDIIPVDLNTFLLWTEKILANFHGLMGHTAQQTFYESAATARRNAINDLMWNETEGAWFDYDIVTESQRIAFYPKNIFPLIVDAYGDNQDRNKTIKQVLQYLKTTNVLTYPSGVPTSLVNSTQQWDFPNGWPPLIDLTITALLKTGDDEAVNSAFVLAQKWLNTNYVGWKTYSNMFEKYDVLEVGERGGGGEYDVEKGFGWTNGVVLKLVDMYAASMTLPAAAAHAPVLSIGAIVGIIAGIFAALALIIGLLIGLK